MDSLKAVTKDINQAKWAHSGSPEGTKSESKLW